jgi:putative ABC transport system permease protein
MRYIFRLATRNIWRNRRRTFITASSIMFAAMLTISMTSVQTGMWDDMLQSVVDQSTGHVQVQSAGYFDQPTLDHTFSLTEANMIKILEHEKVDKLNPRLESFILAANDDRTRPVMVFGVDPQRESDMTGLDSRVIAGNYFTSAESEGVILSGGLAERMGFSVGDSIVFLGQGYRGATAVGLWPVIGIVDLPIRELNNQSVYMTLPIAWDLFQAYDQYTGVMVRSVSNSGLESLQSEVSAIISDETINVLTWQEMMPELMEAKQVDEASTLITMYVLYLVVAFGIFGTLLMMLNERTYEMGVLVSIGMKRRQLMLLMWLEFLLMASIGLIAGMLLAFGVVSYLYHFPLPLGDEMQEVFDQFGMVAQIKATINPMIFVRETLTVIAIVTILSLFPIWKIYRLNPIVAMRS